MANRILDMEDRIDSFGDKILKMGNMVKVVAVRMLEVLENFTPE